MLGDGGEGTMMVQAWVVVGDGVLLLLWDAVHLVVLVVWCGVGGWQ
jgi:hypothetical protein